MDARTKRLPSGRVLALLALLVATVAIVSAATLSPRTGVLVAQPGVVNNTVINACADKTTGLLRLVLPPGPCRQSETAISWNIQGPPGAPGVSGLERVDFSSRSDDTARKNAFAQCPDGKLVVGGGAQVFIAGGASGVIALLKKSQPSDAMDGWAATGEAITGSQAGLNWFVTSYALCATVQQ